MIIEFIFSTSNYLQKKKKKKLVIMITLVMIIRNIYIHQKDAVYYINVLMLSCKHY